MIGMVQSTNHTVQRLSFCASAMMLMFLLISFKLFQLAQNNQQSTLVKEAFPSTPSAHYGSSRLLIGGNLKTFSVYAMPSSILHKKKTASQLAAFFSS